jgi:hypothetical protein
MSELYHLLPSDTGLSILDIRAKHDYDALEANVAEGLKSLQPLEPRVRPGVARYIMRLLPYQTVGEGRRRGSDVRGHDQNRRIRQVVDSLRQAEQQRTNELDSMLKRLPLGVAISEDPESGTVRLNREGARILGAPESRSCQAMTRRNSRSIATLGDSSRKIIRSGVRQRQANRYRPSNSV